MRLFLIAVFVLFGTNQVHAQACDAADAECKAEQGFTPLFDGKTLDGWQGSIEGYAAEDAMLVCLKGGHLFTKEEYADFVFRFEFKLPAGGNNGVALRSPLGCNPAYCGMECQILDNTAERYKTLKPYQYHGSIYGVAPAKRGHLKPVGEWNSEEIQCEGRHVKVTLNDVVIVDVDLDEVGKNPIDGHPHPGLARDKGHIGFLGHGARIEFRNLRIKELEK